MSRTAPHSFSNMYLFRDTINDKLKLLPEFLIYHYVWQEIQHKSVRPVFLINLNRHVNMEQIVVAGVT